MTELILEGVKVLCVDDMPDALDLLSLILERYGAVVTACRSGKDALEAIHRAKFDVIVSDLSMPGMDGYDLAHALRKLENEEGGHKTPAMAVSANADSPDKKRRFADFQVYLTKPFNPNHLVRIVDRLAEADGDSVKAGSLEEFERKKAARN